MLNYQRVTCLNFSTSLRLEFQLVIFHSLQSIRFSVQVDIVGRLATLAGQRSLENLTNCPVLTWPTDARLFFNEISAEES